jgi:glycosyltransferase involved in cell wall biosynthesis
MVPEPKRVLYLQPNNEVGGSDIALLRLIDRLNRSDYTPVVALPGDGPLSEPLRQTGAELHFVPMRQLRTLPSPTYQAKYLAGMLPTIRQIRTLITDERISFVHTNSLYCPYGAWAAYWAGCPHLWHVREIPPAIPIARRLYAEMVERLSARVVSMTTACVDGLFGPGRSPRNGVILPDGIDVGRWHPGISGDRIRRELNLTATAPVIGFIARLDPWKGLEVFLRAAKRVSEREPAAQFLIVGDAPSGFEAYRDAMKSLAGSLGLDRQVHFLGWRYRLDDIPEVMAALTVLCHTPVRPEPFGLVVIEAMAVGCPVVAPCAGGPAETVLEGVTGFLVAPGDADAFADRLCQVIAQRDGRAQMSSAARKRVVEEYSSERFGERLAEIYAGVLEDPSSTPKWLESRGVEVRTTART